MSGIRRLAPMLGVVLAILVAAQTSGEVTYICGRCGAYKQVFFVVGVPITIVRAHDRHGLAATWRDAHGDRPCTNIWVRDGIDGRYWNELRAAAALGWDGLAARLKAAGVDELNRPDALGRTVMHWLLARQGSLERDEMIAHLVRRGARLDAPDEDGMTPLDWRETADVARLKRSNAPCRTYHCGVSF